MRRDLYSLKCPTCESALNIHQLVSQTRCRCCGASLRPHWHGGELCGMVALESDDGTAAKRALLEAALAELQDHLAELINAEWAAANASPPRPSLGSRPTPGLGFALSGAISMALAFGSSWYFGLKPSTSVAVEAAGFLGGSMLVLLGAYRQRRATKFFERDLAAIVESIARSRELRLSDIRMEMAGVRADIERNRSMLKKLS